ncbi:MAG TPA: aminotransferase class V-fold PLP-dependent enzyme [Candidatus Pullichristensenella excrementigallinarum]|uniref:cysteine desulfurase n=1 Tax=Candidatus Pullichristensenella excrementigallinarum TaxID=2840907 RepID=A0A9D1LCL1_9FIRM|nr:aminotransferase class V-fold PLP-dependent enzyme [Candidatus Pullichristensenella excrementigallinarum]
MDIYLDNAATSHPKPEAVLQAVREALTVYNANPGRSGHRRALEAGRRVLNCREEIAGLLGKENPFCIAFGFNCTDSLNLAIKGSLRPGDHVISTMLEHNAILRVLSGLLRKGGIEITLLSPQDGYCIDPEDVRRAIRKNTRLIAITHASNVTGAIQPVAAIGQIAREAGIRYLIDGAQALGSMPVNVDALGCQLYAFPGHKSLLGPQGTGGLYIDPEIELETVREGGTGSSSDSILQPEERPERYESGTLNLPGIAGLLEGVRYVRKNLSQIFMGERETTTALWEGLREMDGVEVYAPAEEAARAGIVSFNVGDLSSSQAADALDQRGIAVRGGLHCAPGMHRLLGTLQRGTVRASVGHATTFEDVEALLRAVRELI